MRVAIIGAGISGLTAAYLLQRQHQVALFEQRATAGGHANTVLVPGPDGENVPLDVGFIVYSEQTYPVFSRLLAELGVETQPSDMSFGVRIEASDFEFSSRGWRGYAAQPRNALNPAKIRIGLDVLRFQRDARTALREGSLQDVPFEDFLARGHYSRGFRDQVIVPLIASTWSNSPSDVLGFPTYYLFKFLEQHGVLAWDSIPTWRWIKGGSRSYVQRVLDSLPAGSACLGEPVASVRRDGSIACVTTRAGNERRFDAVVLACHADEALDLLDDASATERDALGGVTYVRNHVALHTDDRVLPRNPRAQAAWNYYQASGEGVPDTLTMTYDLNQLQRLPGSTRYCVSVNPAGHLDPAKVIACFDYSHPVYSLKTQEAQRRIEAIQGEQRTYFAGAYLGYGFHEDGAAAGARVAARLGVAF